MYLNSITLNVSRETMECNMYSLVLVNGDYSVEVVYFFDEAKADSCMRRLMAQAGSRLKAAYVKEVPSNMMYLSMLRSID